MLFVRDQIKVSFFMNVSQKEPVSKKDLLILFFYFSFFALFAFGYFYLSSYGFGYISSYGEKMGWDFLSADNVFFRISYALIAVFLPVLSLVSYIKISLKNDYRNELSTLNEKLKKSDDDSYFELLALAYNLIRHSEFDKFETDLLPHIKKVFGQNKKEECRSIELLLAEIKEIKPSYHPGKAKGSYLDYQNLSKKQYKIGKILESFKNELIFS